MSPIRAADPQAALAILTVLSPPAGRPAPRSLRARSPAVLGRRAVPRWAWPGWCKTDSVDLTDGVPSPGTWQPPPGTLPAWNWMPPDHGLRLRLDRVAGWVRVWYRTPFLDRRAHAWMWDHGGWDIVPAGSPGPEERGVREPLVPKPSPQPELHMVRDPTSIWGWRMGKGTGSYGPGWRHRRYWWQWWKPRPPKPPEWDDPSEPGNPFGH